MATMDRPSRIVRCPKCLALLQEPPPGTPLYKCGNCSTVLRAKHASSDSSGARRVSDRVQRQNRATPLANSDNIEGRKLPSKLVPPDYVPRQENFSGSDDHRIRTGNNRLTPADHRIRTGNNRPTPAETAKKSPSHHSSFPPGPTPPINVPSSTNTYDDGGFRAGREYQRLTPRDPLPSHSGTEEDSLHGRQGATDVTQTMLSTPAHVNEAYAGQKQPNHMHHTSHPPLAYQVRNPLAICETTDEEEVLVSLRARYSPIIVNVNTRQKSPHADSVADAARFRRPPAEMASEPSDRRERERQWKPEDEDDLRSFSPTKALAALKIQNAGPLYKVNARSETHKERQMAGLGPTRSRHKSQGDESKVTKISDFGYGKNLDGLRNNIEPGPSTGRSREEKIGLHRRQRSDGVSISERPLGNDLYVGHPAPLPVTRRRSEDEVKATDMFFEEHSSMHHVSENERSTLHTVEVPVEKQKTRDDLLSARVDEVVVSHDQMFIARSSSSDVAKQLNETSSGSSPEAITSEQGLPPANDVSLVQRRQQEELDLKARRTEKPVVSNGTFDEHDEHELRALPGKQEQSPTHSPIASRKSLSPPRNIAMSPPSSHSSMPVFGGVLPHPEPLSKGQGGSHQDSDAPSNSQDLYGLPDVLDYESSDGSSNVDDADPYQVTSKPHSEEPKSSTLSRNGQGSQADVINDNNKRSDDEEEPEVTDSRSPDASPEGHLGVVDSVGSGASPHSSPRGSPDSIHFKSPSQAQTSDPRKHQLQENFTRQSNAPELSNSFSFGQGGEVRGSAYSLLKGQTQKVRLQINTPVPDRIHVRCRHCKLQLEVPLNLSRSETGLQKLRCGSCWKISRFRLNHLLSPSRSSSPAASDNSPESSFRLGSNYSDGMCGRYSGTRSNRETGSQDRVVVRTQSGANLPVPPSARHNPRAASGSKLGNTVLGSNLPSDTSKASTPNTSGDLGPVGGSCHGGKENVDTSPSGQAEPSYASLSPTFSSTSQDAGTNRQQKASPERRLLQSSSDSDEEKTNAQVKIGTSAFPARISAWPAPETPEFDDGHEFKGIKGFLKKSVKELTKGKKSAQYRRKVVVNGHAVPDDVVKKAEEYAGVIHPGSYWYDYRAGFWGVMGGPCLGMIPPFIEELNFTLARHCSHGKTGVLVNGRELHHKDLELLKRRGLPGTPGKAYNVDIDGRLTEDTTGIELKGLGRLAPTLEQTGRGPGMWVPESQRGS